VYPSYTSSVSCIISVPTRSNDKLLSLVAGTLGSAGATLLLALINPAAPYWAYAFPSVVISVIGVDLIFAAGSLFIAKVSLPHEQSVAGALFQTMTQVCVFSAYSLRHRFLINAWPLQLGTAVGVTVSTVVFNRVTSTQKDGRPTLKSYHAAQWTAFAFGMLGTLIPNCSSPAEADECFNQ
jgi:hypothetical protein